MSFDYPTTILNRNANQSIATGTWTRVSWDDEQEDDLGAANLGADATKITIPAGVLRARFTFYVAWDNNSSGSRYMTVEKNSNGTQGSAAVVGFAVQEAANETGMEIVTKWVPVVPGDAFEFWVNQNHGSGLDISGTHFGFPSYVQAEFDTDKTLLLRTMMNSVGVSKSAGVTLSADYLTATATGTADQGVYGRDSKISGKYYWEVTFNAIGGTGTSAGIRTAGRSWAEVAGFAGNAASAFRSGSTEVNGTSTTSLGSSLSSQTLGIALDLDAKLIWFRVGTGNYNGSALANPATGVGGFDISSCFPGAGAFPYVALNNSGDSATFNFGGSAYVGTAPSGFGDWTNAVDNKLWIDPQSNGLNGNNSNVGSSTVTLPGTAGPDRIILVHAFNDGANGARGTRRTVSTVTDTNSLTWTKATEFDFTGSAHDGGPGLQTLETWWAYAPTALGSTTITVTLTGNADALSLQCYAVGGADTTTPFDTNGSLPATTNNNSASQASVSGVSTTSPDVLVIAVWGGDNGPTSNGLPFGGVNLADQGGHTNNAPQAWTSIWSQAESFKSAVSSATIATGTGGPNLSSWGYSVSALKAPTTGVSGTLDSTEDKDVFAANSSPAGTWASTESPDVLAATGYPDLHGTMAPTEAKDVFAADGIASTPMGIEAHATGHTSSNGTSATVTLTTLSAHDVLVLCISSKGGPVTSVSDVAGLTWTKRTAYNPPSNTAQDLEIWWAHAPSILTADVITVHTTSSSGICLGVFAVVGANTGVPFDAHNANSITVDNGGGFGNPAATISTDNTSSDGTIIFGFLGSDEAGAGGVTSVATGMDTFLFADDTTGGQANTVAVGYKKVTSAQTGFSLSFTQSGGAGDRYLMADAIICGGYKGTFTTTEAPDAMAFTGGLLGGSWHSTEPTDLMTFAGYPDLQGTFTPTEAKDVFDFHGPVQGTLAVTEGVDTFAGTGGPLPPLGLDGHSHGGATGSGITSGTVSITTTQVDDVIVLLIVSGGFFNHAPVTSITDVAGLTWKKRQQRNLLGAQPSAEIWWAHAPTPLTSNVITVHTGATDAINITAFGVNGANYLTPWDLDSQAGWCMDNYGTGNPTPEVRTQAHDTFLIAFYAGTIDNDGTVLNADYTLIEQNTELGSIGIFSAFAAHITHTPMTTRGYTVGFGQSGGASNIRTVMLDAIVGAGQHGTNDAVRWHFDGYMPFGPGIRVLSGLGNSVTQNVLTFEKDEVVVCAVLIETGTGGSVSSISDDSGGTSPWQLRSRVENNTGTLALEIWYAWANLPFSTSNVTVTCDSVSPGDTIGFIAFGINGPNFFEIWDVDGSLPRINHGDAPPPTYQSVTGVSTVNLNCLILGFGANADQFISGFNVEPFRQTTNSGGAAVGGPTPLESSAPGANIATEFTFAPLQVSNITVEFDTSPQSISWLMIADALPVGPPTPPTGVWHSTEGLDVVNAAGYVPAFATWNSTEAQDRFTGAPAQAPYLSVGWLGWIPAFATWASTEAKDHLSGAAWVLGEPLTGQWHSIEDKDSFGASNIATVTGIWSSHERADNWSSAGLLIPTGAPAPPTRKRRLMIVN